MGGVSARGRLRFHASKPSSHRHRSARSSVSQASRATVNRPARCRSRTIPVWTPIERGRTHTFPIPKSFFLTRGIGTHREQLTAFELALRDADIEQQNLVTVSSILPPGCVEMERDAGVATLRPGEITFAVMARSEANEPGRRVN